MLYIIQFQFANIAALCAFHPKLLVETMLDKFAKVCNEFILNISLTKTVIFSQETDKSNLVIYGIKQENV